MSELKPCPFCGSADIKIIGRFERYAVCMNCDVAGPQRPADEEVTGEWNTRPGEKAAAAAALREAADKLDIGSPESGVEAGMADTGAMHRAATIDYIASWLRQFANEKEAE